LTFNEAFRDHFKNKWFYNKAIHLYFKAIEPNKIIFIEENHGLLEKIDLDFEISSDIMGDSTEVNNKTYSLLESSYAKDLLLGDKR